MAKLIKAIKPIETVREFFSATLAILGAYFLMVNPNMSGMNRAEVSNNIISNIGMEKLALKRINTRVGRTKGTAIEVNIISPTTIGSLPPTKLTTNGAPRPVDMPVNNRIGKAKSGEMR